MREGVLKAFGSVVVFVKNYFELEKKKKQYAELKVERNAKNVVLNCANF